MIDMRLLVVDLLAERKAFGKEGVREIIAHLTIQKYISGRLTLMKESNTALGRWFQNQLIVTISQ